MSDSVPQSWTRPERVKTINDFRKLEKASRMVMVCGRIGVGDGIGCEGEVLPEASGLVEALETDFGLVGGLELG